MQVAFLPQVPLYGEEFHVTVAGKLHQLYAQSYFNFGANGIKSQVAEWLSARNPKTSQMADPCMLQGDSRSYTLNSGSSITLTGAGNAEDCLNILTELVQPAQDNDCQLKPCAIGAVYQPQIPDSTFYAIGALKYTLKTLDVLGEDKVLHINRLEEAAAQYCSLTLEAATQSGIPAKYASGYCIMGLYVPTFLKLSYGFPEDTTNILATDNINGQDFDWALGAMLINLNNRQDASDYSVKRK